MTNDEGPTRGFDREERTGRFGEAVITFAKKIPVTLITTPLIPQLVRAATSIGANYLEADDADSPKDFRYRIGVARREARETKHQLRMVVAAVPQLRDEARPLWQEAKELNLIFGAIRRNGEKP